MRAVVALAVAVLSLLPITTRAQGAPTPRPSATATKTPEPTPTPPPGKCCWCVQANDGEYSEAESRKMYDYCDKCLMDPAQNPKAVGCYGSYNTSASRFESDLAIAKSRGECSKEAYVANMQHGPIFDVVSGLISVCVKQFPSCSIELDDRSCQTFRNETEAQVFLTSLQSELGDEGSVTVCGNSSDNYTMTCARLAASKRYVVSKHSLSEEVMRCNREGLACSPIGDSWQCLDFGKKIITQKCCGKKTSKPEDSGRWVNNVECRGDPECPDRCKMNFFGVPVFRDTCTSPTKRRTEWCEGVSGGGYKCAIMEKECRLFQLCENGECVDEHSVPVFTPTAIATTSPTTRAKTAKSNSRAANIISQLGSITPAKGVPHHFVASPATLSVAFTPQLFYGDSTIADFEGRSRETGVALITVDPVSTVGMVGLQAGDVIRYVNDQPIKKDSDIFDALAQSRTRTFITYSRAAPEEQAESTSVLPKPARWNWIVTIHAMEKESRGSSAKGRERAGE